MQKHKTLRNIAIVAHVDHGKTTLVDHMFRQAATSALRAGDQLLEDRVMDSGDLERERGITITAKNCAVEWNGVKINILDTPGHADFGGEVERALMMVDGVILLVDAAEGPLPQTRFVMQKALNMGLSFIVCINKIDRPDARPNEVLSAVYDLFIDLDAHEDQLDFPVLYTIGRQGIASRSLDKKESNLNALFETIIEKIPAPKCDKEGGFQMIVANLDYCDYLGGLVIGRVQRGSVKTKDALVKIGENGVVEKLKTFKLQQYHETRVVEVEEAEAGDIILIAGVEKGRIGDTVASQDIPEALPRIKVDPPTVSMVFTINTSPLSGREGKFVQSQRIAERLQKEMLYNVGLQLEQMENSRESFIVKGRGEFQLGILIETMRREGFELTVGRPQIILRKEDGKTLEPIEHLVIDCDEASLGVVTEKLSQRKGRMTNMVNHGSGRVKLEFSIPTRGIIGYRNQFMTDTRGTGLMYSYLEGYEEFRGDFPSRISGSLVSDRTGNAVAYGLDGLEDRGRLFVIPGDVVYEGMIVGEHNRSNDLNVNVTKSKKLTNMRASGKDDGIQLTPVIPMTLEQAIDFIREDELVEVTPKSIRLRKASLSAHGRKDRL